MHAEMIAYAKGSWILNDFVVWDAIGRCIINWRYRSSILDFIRWSLNLDFNTHIISSLPPGLSRRNADLHIYRYRGFKLIGSFNYNRLTTLKRRRQLRPWRVQTTPLATRRTPPPSSRRRSISWIYWTRRRHLPVGRSAGQLPRTAAVRVASI